MPRLPQALASCVLILRYLGRVLWAPLSFVAVFGLLAAFDLLPGLSPWLHAAVIAAFAVAFAAALRRGVLTERPPRNADIWRSIEQSGGLSHRPYDTLNDRSARRHGDHGLWALHQRRAADEIAKARLTWPRSRDSRPLRALAALALLIGIVAASYDFGSRLDAALSPGVLGADPLNKIALEAWLTPPDYTGLPPVILTHAAATNDDAIEVPVGSRLEAHITGGSSRPHLIVDGKRQKFSAIDKHTFQLSVPLLAGSDISITQGWRTLGKWQVSLAETPAPVIEWVKPPAAAEKTQVKFDYTAADMYGLAALGATIRLADEVRPTMLPKGSALDTIAAGEFTVPLSDVSGHPKSVKASTLEDWTSNPWAGFPVTVALSATAVSGKMANTAPQPLVLPERSFTDPAARAIIAERKKLTLDPVQQRIEVAAKLAELAGHHDLYHDDAVVFLVLRTAASRLWQDDRFTELRDIQSMLWQAAVRLEDGATGSASKQIAEAAKALREALNNGAPQSTIDKLTQNLKQAMNQYLDQMEKDLAKRLAKGEQFPMAAPDAKSLDRKSLDDMVDKLNSLSQSGNRDAAKDALAEIESMMRNLRMAEKMQPGSKAMQAWNAMRQLRDLAEKQQQLKDKTYRRAHGDTTGGDEMQSLNNGRSADPRHRAQNEAESNGSEQQQGLKDSLHGVQQDLGKLGAEIPGGLKDSEQAMGGAGGKLKREDYEGALPLQQQALDKLREGMQSLTEQMNKGGGGGLALGSDEKSEGKPGEDNSDPFGRDDNTGKSTDDQRVHIPDQASQERSREILEELRKRSGENFRPRDERDYIDRLLKDY